MSDELRALPPAELEAMAAAGRAALAVERDGSLFDGLLDGRQPPPYAHCPPGDVYDPVTHSQYYYHVHRPGEAGHFHAFLRGSGMPPGVRPADIPGHEPPFGNAAISHLIALGISPEGRLDSLFTTNRWVTDETWYDADDVVRMLPRFMVARNDWPVHGWISNVVRLFRPTIAGLVKQRDRCLRTWATAHPSQSPWDDRGLEMVAEAKVSVAAQLAEVEAALAESAA